MHQNWWAVFGLFCCTHCANYIIQVLFSSSHRGWCMDLFTKISHWFHFIDHLWTCWNFSAASEPNDCVFVSWILCRVCSLSVRWYITHIHRIRHTPRHVQRTIQNHHFHHVGRRINHQTRDAVENAWNSKFWMKIDPFRLAMVAYSIEIDFEYGKFRLR